jgi:hypothetical protein
MCLVQKGGLNMEKSPIFLGAVGGVDGQTGVSLALNADHARQRRALGWLFTNSALRHFENLMKIQVQKFVAVLGQKAEEGQAADMSSWCRCPSRSSGLVCEVNKLTGSLDTYLAFDIMGDLCFAEPFGCLEQASNTEWSTSVINVFVAAVRIPCAYHPARS